MVQRRVKGKDGQNIHCSMFLLSSMLFLDTSALVTDPQIDCMETISKSENHKCSLHVCFCVFACVFLCVLL